jgi:hypothetical protein
MALIWEILISRLVFYILGATPRGVWSNRIGRVYAQIFFQNIYWELKSVDLRH